MTRHFLHSLTLDRGAVADWEHHPFSVPAIRSLETLELHPKVTFFVGENGSGKSTLLEAIAEKLGFRIAGGSRVKSRAKHDYASPLTQHISMSRTSNRPMDGFFLRAESFYNWATELDELEATPFCGGVLGSYGGKSLHAQSHGESFLNLLTQRIDGHGSRRRSPMPLSNNISWPLRTWKTCERKNDFPLTPALSPREREPDELPLDWLKVSLSSGAAAPSTPSPMGGGRGEGEALHASNARTTSPLTSVSR